MLEWTDISIWK